METNEYNNYLEYEKVAMAGQEMPYGLDFPDQLLFLQLRCLYDSYKKGIVDRPTAVAEKAELLRTYKNHKMIEQMGRDWIKTIKDTEICRAEYRKNKTIENADRLLFVIEGGRLIGSQSSSR